MDHSSKFNTVEWFFGYGGNHLGLKRVLPNLCLLALCEIEEFAIENILAKMENGLLEAAPIWSDCKTFPREPFKNRVDLFIGSYPCQPFSSAGKRQGADDPRHLWPYVRGFVRDVRPRLCFFENVDGHVSMGLSTVISDLEQDGYKTAWGVFSAAEVGAPHQRKRVFILAYSDSERGFLQDLWRITSESVSFSYGSTRGNVWPSRPGEPQHEWEPPRVVADGNSIMRRKHSKERERHAEARSTSQELGDTSSFRLRGSCEDSRAVDEDSDGEECGVHESEGASPLSRDGSQSETVADSRCIGSTKCEQQTTGIKQSDEVMGDPPAVDGTGQNGGLGEMSSRGTGSSGDEWEIKSPLGRSFNESPDRLDDAELYVSCDNRTDELRLLGNGVTPATAEKAFRILLKELLND